MSLSLANSRTPASVEEQDRLFAVAVSGFDRSYSGSEIGGVVETILGACAHVKKFMSGRGVASPARTGR